MIILCVVNVELRLRKCYQAIPFEAISEADTRIGIDRDNHVSIG